MRHAIFTDDSGWYDNHQRYTYRGACADITDPHPAAYGWDFRTHHTLPTYTIQNGVGLCTVDTILGSGVRHRFEGRGHKFAVWLIASGVEMQFCIGDLITYWKQEQRPVDYVRDALRSMFDNSTGFGQHEQNTAYRAVIKHYGTGDADSGSAEGASARRTDDEFDYDREEHHSDEWGCSYASD